MRKFLVSTLAILAVYAVGMVSASAVLQADTEPPPIGVEPPVVQPIELGDPVDPEPIEPEPVEPEPIVPLPYGAVHLVGEVWANGVSIGEIDFAIVWNEDDPSHAQLWALLNDVPTQVCAGRIFETPQGEPIFFGSTSLMDPAGTCYMSRVPNHSAISLHAASNDGQWAVATLTNPNSVEPVPIFD